MVNSWGQPVWQYTASPEKISFHWRDQQKKVFNTLDALIKSTKTQDILFAMNGGMFTADYSPLGLYIENGRQLRPIIYRKKAYGNFYIQPNGVFAIDRNHKAKIFVTEEFKKQPSLKFATQSGPMLLHHGKINRHFTKNSKNLEIRNGVGILPTGDVLMAVSQKPINFYDFAQFFKAKGCQEALYLDGSISQVYSPQDKVEQLHGLLGVIIAVRR